MVSGTGKTAFCLDSNFGVPFPPEPVIPLGRDDLPVRESSSTVCPHHKIRVDLCFAPVERERGKYGYRKTIYQATRCPFCKALVASGLSWEDHTFFCNGISEKPLINGVGSGDSSPLSLGTSQSRSGTINVPAIPSKRMGGYIQPVVSGWKVSEVPR